MAKVLVVEDDPAMAAALSEWLEAEGHRAEIAYNGIDGLESLKYKGFDLAIVDWQMPGMDGIELCTSYRAGGGRVPILMLTQKSNVQEKTTGLDSGADDYLPKPFDLRELAARVRALLRRSTNLFDARKKTGQLILEYGECSVVVRGKKIKLLPKEFDLLEFLMRHPKTFFTPDKLLDFVWKSDSDAGHEAIRTCISRLRGKIDEPDQPSVIETSKGWGYKISDEYAKDLPESQAESHVESQLEQ